MIQQAYINHWRATEAPWSSDSFVEHDLVLSRAIIEIFSNELLSDTMALRGGTALNKIHLKKFGRFSEDIDLVQIKPGDNGPFIDAVRSCLDSWLGSPKRKVGEGVTTLTYKFITEDNLTMKLKVETNTREHKSVYPIVDYHFDMKNDWFSGKCIIKSYTIEELLSTKLRALYQRKKGRDLYDFWATSKELKINYSSMVKAFYYYIKLEGLEISRDEIDENLKDKLSDKTFINDIKALLKTGVEYDPQEAGIWFEKIIMPYLNRAN